MDSSSVWQLLGTLLSPDAAVPLMSDAAYFSIQSLSLSCLLFSGIGWRWCLDMPELDSYPWRSVAAATCCLHNFDNKKYYCIHFTMFTFTQWALLFSFEFFFSKRRLLCWEQWWEESLKRSLWWSNLLDSGLLGSMIGTWCLLCLLSVSFYRCLWWPLGTCKCLWW